METLCPPKEVPQQGFFTSAHWSASWGFRSSQCLFWLLGAKTPSFPLGSTVTPKRASCSQIVYLSSKLGAPQDSVLGPLLPHTGSTHTHSFDHYWRSGLLAHGQDWHCAECQPDLSSELQNHTPCDVRLESSARKPRVTSESAESQENTYPLIHSPHCIWKDPSETEI